MNRGLSLIETLIALLVLSAGLATLARSQRWLWQHTELSRQRADALRLVQNQLEQARAFTRVDITAGESAWTDLGAEGDREVSDRAASTVYVLSRSVATTTAPQLKTVTQQARWTDRTGTTHTLALTTALAALDPRAGGWLSLAPDDRSHAAPLGRHAAIPVAARDLGDGRSAFKPLPEQTLTWVFENSSGVATQRCDSPVGLANSALNAATLTGCTSINGLLISGTVRFATDSSALGATDAERPGSAALNLDLTLSVSGAPSPPWECVDNAPSTATPGQTAVRYWCMVAVNGTPPRWSGRLDVAPSGWTLGRVAGTYRVCRYSADRDGDGLISTPEHPASYTNVNVPLAQQNFLVVQGLAACPVDGPVNLAAEPPNFADDSTVAHQP